MPKILIIDDNEGVQKLLRIALLGKGVETDFKKNTKSALLALEANDIDLITLDLHLGNESGLELLKIIRQGSRRIPVVVFSGYLNDQVEKECRLAGANEVLCKDIPIDNLVTQVMRIIHARDRILQHPTPRADQLILIVDDDSQIRNLLEIFFKKKGYQVKQAENAQEAITTMRNHSCNLVLLDMHLPDQDGLTTLQKLIQINPAIGVLMITGDSDISKVSQAISLGAYGYILKPFDFLYLELVVLSKLAIAQTPA